MKNKTLLSGAGILIALVLFVSLNVLSSATLRSARLDLTENKLYTLSEGTKSILAKLDEPIKLRLYFTTALGGEHPQYEAHFRRVEDLLIEYSRLSGGMITVEVHNPEPFSETEERAIQYGLRGAPANRGGDLLYFGLVGTNSTDREETIPFFQLDKEPFLEYDLTRLVHTLSDTQQSVIGVMSQLPIEGAMPNPMMMQQQRPPQPWILVDQMRQLFQVQTIPPTATEIPGDVDVLMVVHPKDLLDDTWYAIDQFVMAGGRAAFFVDPFCEKDQPPSDPSNPMAAFSAKRSSSLGPLASSLGLDMAEGVFAADRKTARRVTINQGGRATAVSYVAWLQLGQDNFNGEDVVTSELSTVNMASAGILEVRDEATTTIEPLIETSPESMRMQTTRIQFGVDPAGLLKDFFPTSEKLLLAARVTGEASSAFPDGPPPAATDEEPEEPQAETSDLGDHLASSDGPINVIVFADADMLADEWWVQAQDFFGSRLLQVTADNGSLAINALDNLTGSSDLISLRGRASSERPFEVVQDLERHAEERFQARYRDLEQKLRDTEQRISELQTQKEGASALILSPEQQAELEAFQQERVNTKKELREVRYELRKDIDRLGAWLKFANILLIPLLIGVAAVGLWLYRVAQTARAAA